MIILLHDAGWFIDFSRLRNFMRRVCCAVFLGVSLSPVFGGHPPTIPKLQPYQVVSSDGSWRVEVEPGKRTGAGPAVTTLTNAKSGEVAWKQVLPYTFWQCCVSDEGVVAGFAYTSGLMVGEPAMGDGQFVVSFLDAQGVTMHEERTRKSQSFWQMLDVTTPAAHGLHRDAGNHRLILHMKGGTLRNYDMRSGELVASFLPARRGDAFGYRWTDEIRFVPGTRLMLLQSNSSRSSGTETRIEDCAQLVDDHGRVVWATSLRETFGRDYVGPYRLLYVVDSEETPRQEQVIGGPFAGIDPFATPMELHGPRAPSEVGRFHVYFGLTKERVCFRILGAGGDTHPPEYHVQESTREKFEMSEPTSHNDEEARPPEDFPMADVEKLGAFQLKLADGEALNGLVAVALGPEETIHVLKKGENRIHVFDRGGKLRHFCDPGAGHVLDSSSYSASIAVDGKGEIHARFDGDAQNPLDGYFLRFSPEGIQLQDPVAAPGDEYSGNHVVHPESGHLIFFGFGDEVVVNRDDAHGSRVATLERRADGQWLEYIQNVACAPNGMIAVRDSAMGNRFGGFGTSFPRMPGHLPAETINLYAADGRATRTLDFSGYAGLSEIAVDGKRILATFRYDPPTPLVYVFDADAVPIGAIRIAELEGRERVNLRAFIVAEGEEVLAVDLESGMVFRFGMP